MRSKTSLKQGIAEAWRMWRRKQYDEALGLVDRLLETRRDNAQLLVMRAQLIQLQRDEDGSPTLDDAKADSNCAVTLDDQSPAALIELGYFLNAVEDHPEVASKYFRKAIDLCQKFLREALIGQADVLVDLGQRRAARDCLLKALWLDTHNGGAVPEDMSSDLLERLQDLMPHSEN